MGVNPRQVPSGRLGYTHQYVTSLQEATLEIQRRAMVAEQLGKQLNGEVVDRRYRSLLLGGREQRFCAHGEMGHVGWPRLAVTASV
jgi:hypothetical protein